jgi:hypothetical protein
MQMNILPLSALVLVLFCLGCDVQQQPLYPVEVRVVTTGTANGVSAFSYGVESNRLDYVVLELGIARIDSHLEGGLTIGTNGRSYGEQHLKLDGFDMKVSSSKRLFIVDKERFYSEPLAISLREFEEEIRKSPSGFSDKIRKTAFGDK